MLMWEKYQSTQAYKNLFISEWKVDENNHSSY